MSRRVVELNRFLFVFLLFASVGTAFGQVRMYVSLNGKRIGQAVAHQKLLPNGGKYVQLSMNLMGPAGKSVTVRMETSFDSKGAPVRKFEETLTSNPHSRKSVTVTFDKAGAHVVREEGGTRTTKDVSLVAGAPTASKSEFWFLRDKPKIGEIDKYYVFDVEKLAWELRTATYGGLKTISLGGKKIAAHEVRQENGIVYLDSTGMPYVMDLGAIKLERVVGP